LCCSGCNLTGLGQGPRDDLCCHVIEELLAETDRSAVAQDRARVRRLFGRL
jgi:hypothetical protein